MRLLRGAFDGSVHPWRGDASVGTRLLLLTVAVLLVGGCEAGDDAGSPLFEAVPASRSNVTFVNDLEEDPAFNLLTYLYFYDGGGVAAGDVNGDSLVDLYFTSNMGPNRLYVNRGDFVFEDVTDAAGVAGSSDWTTGVAMADVNGDGLLDLYVTAVNQLNKEGRNELFINNGDGTFTEEAAAYGLDFRGYSTHATFFDYDLDGDLDLYLLNHSLHSDESYGKAETRLVRHPFAGDRLYRNEGGRFVDVSEQAGIYGSALGYGLSVTVGDLNVDGYPDLYVANDFHENDYLYLNNGDGTFREVIEQAVGHTSLSSMGSDIADFNNDGRPDIVVLDMLPDEQEIRNRSAGAEPFAVYAVKREFGYHHQLARNTLLLNWGRARFSDVALLAGIEATDWSWAPLFADFDNDGLKDLFVTNGIYRRPNDLDFVRFISHPQVQAIREKGIPPDSLQPWLERMPRQPLPNYAFRNNGDLTFENRAAAWGLDTPGFSNGAVYADLDNDGDLDLVTNNIEAPASIYRNNVRERYGRHYLRVVLEGEGGNTAGIGAKVILRAGGVQQMQELVPARGWQSSVDPRLHFGLGEHAAVDTLVVIWPDGRAQTLMNVPADQELRLRQADADSRFVYPDLVPEEPLFQDVTDEVALSYVHQENRFFDVDREPLMPHMLSSEGPALAVGDVNGDGLDDLFVGGAKWQPARLFVQERDGRFWATNQELFAADSLHEDVDATLFDADTDGDLDLYVVSAGNEFWGQADALRDRLYVNDGNGRFARAHDALPPFHENGACIEPADYDGDGDLDLFVGARVVTQKYGVSPRSYLLENDGQGRFRDVTEERAPALAEIGMVTGAVWTDYDVDGLEDLVVVGEWLPVTAFRNTGTGFERVELAGLEQTHGWWNTVVARDMDRDGDPDLIAGNLGLNSTLKANEEQPVRLYLDDFDGNGKLDPILTQYRHGQEYPWATPEMLSTQLPFLHQRYASFADFGDSRLEDMLTPEELRDARVLEAYTFETSYIENLGGGRFSVHPLPAEAQLAPVRAVQIEDLDGDGHLDVLLAGNFFGVVPHRGRYDASLGLVLLGDGQGRFEVMEPGESNLWLEGEARHVAWLRRADGSRNLIVARNNDRLQIIRHLRETPVLARGSR